MSGQTATPQAQRGGLTVWRPEPCPSRQPRLPTRLEVRHLQIDAPPALPLVQLRRERQAAARRRPTSAPPPDRPCRRRWPSASRRSAARGNSGAARRRRPCAARPPPPDPPARNSGRRFPAPYGSSRSRSRNRPNVRALSGASASSTSSAGRGPSGQRAAVTSQKRSRKASMCSGRRRKPAAAGWPPWPSSRSPHACSASCSAKPGTDRPEPTATPALGAVRPTRRRQLIIRAGRRVHAPPAGRPRCR